MRGLNLNRILLVFLLAFAASVNGQTVGIGTDFPIASLDIRTANPISSIYAERLLGTGSGVGAIRVDDNSDWVAVEIYERADALAGIYVQNEGGGQGIWVYNTDVTNSQAAGYFRNDGTGVSVEARMVTGVGNALNAYVLNNTSTAYAIDATQIGLGDGINIYMDDFFNTGSNVEDALHITQLNDAGFGIFNDVRNASQAMLNSIEEGIGVSNIHFGDSSTSFIANMEGLVGDGYLFTNVDNTAAPTVGGDGFGYQAYVNTQTPSVVPVLTGGVLVGVQYGPGWGMLINHLGNSGRNAELNINNSANNGEAFFSAHLGGGSNILVQNQSTVVHTAPIEMIRADYLGTDASFDHIAISGFSRPANNFGIGVSGYGGYIGVLGATDTITGGNSISSLAAVLAEGDLAATGVKAFMIDHPLHPDSKILKHFALESNDVLNVYQGNALIGNNGQTLVNLPDYFHAINIDYNYQLTSIGTSEQAWIAKEIKNGEFVIAGKPNSKVSWMVIAKRNDAYVRNNPVRLINEVDKRAKDIGKYLDPGSYNLPANRGIFYKSVKKEEAMQIPNVTAAQNTSREQFQSKKIITKKVSASKAKLSDELKVD